MLSANLYTLQLDHVINVMRKTCDSRLCGKETLTVSDAHRPRFIKQCAIHRCKRALLCTWRKRNIGGINGVDPRGRHLCIGKACIVFEMIVGVECN